MKKKAELQKDLTRLLGQARVGIKKFGKELNIFAKKSEKEIVKASRSGKIQLDIMGLAMQKEKLYYDIGKKTASLNSKKKLGIAALDSYWKRLRKLEGDTRKKKRELSAFRSGLAI